MSEYKTIGQVERMDPGLDALIAPDASIEQLDIGFSWTEGPLWITNGNYLLFSDIPRNAIMQWSSEQGVRIWMQSSGYTGVVYYCKEPGSNGLTLDNEGRLLACEHGDRRVSRLEPNGGKMTVVDCYQGKRLNSPNDLVVHSNGNLYFTDPACGLHFRYKDPARELPFCGVFLVRSGEREAVLLTAELENPNGLAFSPDEKSLYVTQSNIGKAILMLYPVNEDGTLGSGSVFCDLTEHCAHVRGAPDGMKVDTQGNVFTTGPGGIWILNPEGKTLGRIVTGKRIANLCWGEDGQRLYICSDDTLCRIKTLTSGTIPGTSG